jgi:hypothetical protein
LLAMQIERARVAKEVLIAGVAGRVAGAMSMAGGEHVSASSQSDTEADLAREHNEPSENPAYEVDELMILTSNGGRSGRRALLPPMAAHRYACARPAARPCKDDRPPGEGQCRLDRVGSVRKRGSRAFPSPAFSRGAVIYASESTASSACLRGSSERSWPDIAPSHLAQIEEA